MFTINLDDINTSAPDSVDMSVSLGFPLEVDWPTCVGTLAFLVCTQSFCRNEQFTSEQSCFMRRCNMFSALPYIIITFYNSQILRTLGTNSQMMLRALNLM